MVGANNNKNMYYITQENVDLNDKYDEAIEFASSGNSEDNFAAGLVFEELFVNIYNYAYEKQGAGPIMANIKHTNEGTEITFVDFGIPFNPVERANWMASAGQIGGRGIDLVKSYSKKFEYERVFGSNVVQVLV